MTAHIYLLIYTLWFAEWTPLYHCSTEVDTSNDTFTQVELGQCDTVYVICQNGTWQNETRQCENGWTYDKTYTTMVTDVSSIVQ